MQKQLFILRLLIIMLMTLLTPKNSLTRDKEIASLNLDLADWGMASIAEVGWIGATLFQNRQGKQLILYGLQPAAPLPSPLAIKSNAEISSATVGRPGTPQSQAIWIWETTKILNDLKKQDKFFSSLRKSNIRILYFQIPYHAKQTGNNWKVHWKGPILRKLVARAHLEGMEIHALDGDPRFAQVKWHNLALNFVESVVDYNREVAPNERFDGIHLDIEPHALEEFFDRRGESLRKSYLRLLKNIRQLTSAAGLRVGVDIPPGYDRQKMAGLEGEEKTFSQAILDIVDEVTLMDYKTRPLGPGGIVGNALAGLQYANSIGKKLWVGLETEPAFDETDLTFASPSEPKPADTTQKNPEFYLVLEPGSGTQIMARLFLGPSPPIGIKNTQRVFSQSSQSILKAKDVSFYGKGCKTLQHAMDESRPEFAKYPSFAGFAFHSYKNYFLLCPP